MAITFSAVPPTAAASAVFVEQEAVKRSTGSPVLPRKILAIGQYDSGKTPANNAARLISSRAEAWNLYGRGSMLALMLERLLASGGGIPVYALPVVDGTRAATGAVVITGTATAAGLLAIYVAGKKILVDVASGAKGGDVGAALATKISGDLDLPAAAANVKSDSDRKGSVTLTALWKGESGNQISLRKNLDPADADPAGLTVTVTTIGGATAGAGDPDLKAAFAALGDTWYTDICMPYTSAAALGAMESAGELRAGPTVRRPFAGIAGYTGSLANFRTLLGTRNSQWTTFVPVHGSETPAFLIAASATAVFAAAQQSNPGRPVKGLRLPGVLDGDLANNLLFTERDAVVKAGGSHTYNQADGTVTLGDLVTTRTTDPVSRAETADWRFTIIIPNLQFKIYALEQTFRASPFARAVVLSDTDGRGPTYGIRPSTVKGYLIGLVDDWVTRGLSTSRDEIVAGITAEIDAANPGRINALVPDVASAGLRIVALKLEWAYVTG